MNIKITGDGSHTLFVPELNEHYHSVNGAINESLHVYINNGFNYCMKDKINIFEVGFGTGLNAILTYIETTKKKIFTNYQSIELYPLRSDVYRLLNYSSLLGKGNTISQVFTYMHTCAWNKCCKLNEYFSLHKVLDNIIDYPFPGSFDVVYFDAFAPDKQPEIWAQSIFDKLFQHLNTGGILTTYCAKGEIKRRLRNVGFLVEYLSGPPGKREMIRAIKK